jgi:hypothetical protein
VSKQASNKDTESLYDRYLRGTAMTHTDLAALAKAWETAVDSYQLGIMPADDVKAAHTAFHAAVAANAAEIERLRDVLVHIAAVLAPGNRTMDEMLRDMGYACDVARRAQAAEGGSDE